jgi:crotonobetainyl-CoA:carnitine CoA-transferase CaiB-like acyl-CoA transferase
MLESNSPVSSSRHDALQGIRVLDFTIVMSGPMCTRTLADLGANVIKVEPPAGDVVRQRPPIVGGTSTYFAAMNCGKRSLVLDLQTDEGRSIARRLAQESDIVVENFRPGVMKRLGLDYETLSASNPRLIYCSVSGFGQTGPMASAPAYAPVIHAASGYELAHMQYQKDARYPANNGIFIADTLGAVHATAAINLALYARERTGLGQYIDVSLHDAVLGMLIYEMQDAQFPASKPRQVYQPVRANDGFVMVAAVTPKNLHALFDAIDFPQGKSDPRFATVRSKEENWAALLEIIEGWTSERSALECENVLVAAGVPCSRYRTVRQAMDDTQTTARGLMAEIGGVDDRCRVANPPYHFSVTRAQARSDIPSLGQHSGEILSTTLGYSAQEVAELRAKGVIG